MVANAWIIAALPLIAYLLTVFVGKRVGERASLFGIVALGVSTLLALVVLSEVIGSGGRTFEFVYPWLNIGGFEVPMGFRVGPVEAVTLTMVTFVAWMIEIYSSGYMSGDSRYNRFYSIVNLFVFAMLTLVMADNLLLFFFAWEVMGLCSYLLIGHYFEDRENARAANKAFLVTRLGDVGFMLGIWFIYAQVGSFRFSDIYEVVEHGEIATGMLTLIGLLLFAGAVGKSAQIPLQIWLPDAMAGPTPVSALIHAATMVAAGVFLVGRAFPIYEAAPVAMTTVAWIGGLTALVAATIATVQEDIKKVLAYSTISQLGYMMLAMGVGGYVAAIFHLLSHAFFKALLFLGSGSVIHAAHTQNMHEMGGLFKKMKVTGATFIVGGLALAGIPPFSGFFSKDEIILEAYHSNAILFWMAVSAAFLTAYYMTRAIWLTFFGKPRVAEVYEHAHESPVNMTLPLVVLAVPAALFGFVGAPFLNSPLQRFIAWPGEHLPEPSAFVQGITVTMAVLGIVLGYLIYATSAAGRRKQWIRALKPLYVLFKQKWYFDHVGWGVAYLTMAASTVVGAFDRWVVDGVVNGVGWAVLAAGKGARRLTVGNAQAYMMTLFAGVIIGIVILAWGGIG